METNPTLLRKKPRSVRRIGAHSRSVHKIKILHGCGIGLEEKFLETCAGLKSGEGGI